MHKEKQKLNLIEHNSAEPTAKDVRASKMEDKLVRFPIVGVTTKVINTLRLGRKGDKPVGYTVDSKAFILQNCITGVDP